MNNYNYDIAFSLCAQDIEFAKKLYDQLNPKLERKFLYPEQQEQLINKHGPEEFRKVFRKEARVVVILYREGWGDTYYTGIEKDAIVERTGDKGEGQDFIFMVPMEKGQTPDWYPSTRIYADPFEFSVEQLARFIEFKITERGGEVIPLTLQEKVEDLEDRLNKKREHIRFLCRNDSFDIAYEELNLLLEKFEEKKNYLKDRDFHESCGLSGPIGDLEALRRGYTYISIHGLGIGLEVTLLDSHRSRTSQSIHLEMEEFIQPPFSENWKEQVSPTTNFYSHLIRANTEFLFTL